MNGEDRKNCVGSPTIVEEGIVKQLRPTFLSDATPTLLVVVYFNRITAVATDDGSVRSSREAKIAPG